MSPQKTTLFALVGLVCLMAGATAIVMLSSTSYMNRAADYARGHLADQSVPAPLSGASPSADPPVRVEALARYNETGAVEVQVTRLYATVLHPQAQFTVTYFYQPVADAWALVPPPASFWGDPKVTRGVRITINHAFRMQRIATDLVASIDAALTAACQQWQCPAGGPQVQLTFITVPGQTGGAGMYPAPEFTGVPLSHDANSDFQSAYAAEAVRLAGAQLGQAPAAIQAEIQRQKLYAAP
jgi:hypothetical protein